MFLWQKKTEAKTEFEMRVTPEQAKKDIRAGLKAMGQGRILLERISTQMRADQLERIFSSGLNENGNLIGDYRPVTAKIRTKYGRPTDTVNLDFTGQTKASYVTNVLSEKKAQLGFIDVSRKDIRGKAVPTKTSQVIEFITDRYGEVFHPTDEELKRTDEIIQDFIDDIKI